MGEIADYIINGDDCQYCGQYLGKGDGYPRTCYGCSNMINDSLIAKEVHDAIEKGLSYLRTAAVILKEAKINKKSKGLHNICNIISKFKDSLK